MFGHGAAGLPRAVLVSAFNGLRIAKARRLRLAVALGAAVVGAGLIGSGAANAANIFQILFGGGEPVISSPPPPTVFNNYSLPLEPSHKRWRHKKTEGDGSDGAPSAARSGAGNPGGNVCVRLCDGFFFPTVSGATDASCSSLCPDAPVALYRRPAGSDLIEQAVSATTGAPYSRLPVAFRNQTTLDSTCTCHHSVVQAFSVRQDTTLRKGDAIMTDHGFEIYDGGAALPHPDGSFKPLASAHLPNGEMVTLTAMERATTFGRVRKRPAIWITSDPAPSASTNGEQKPHDAATPLIATQ